MTNKNNEKKLTKNQKNIFLDLLCLYKKKVVPLQPKCNYIHRNEKNNLFSRIIVCFHDGESN